MAKKLKIRMTTFENTSLLRKLSIFYFIISIIPISVLYYLYTQLRDYGQLVITEENLAITLFFVVLGVGIGYFALRSMIITVIDISRKNREALENILGPEKIKKISSGISNEVALLAKSFNEITTHLEENVRDLELAKKTLHSVLSKVGEGISSMDNIDTFLNLIVETVTEALQAECGALLMIDKKKNNLFVKEIYGKKYEKVRSIRLDCNKGVFSFVLEAKQPVVLDNIPREGAVAALFTAPVLCAPLMLHDNVLGVIAVSNRRSDQAFDEEEKTLLNNVALQTAVAIENSKLNDDAEKTYFETISALALAVEAKDTYSRGHSERVAKISIKIAEALNLSDEDISVLRDAAKLHDLGKIGVTDEVLKKEGSLSAQEMEMMRKHPEIGEGIIKPIRSLRGISHIVRHHHEKLDGSGYPDGLKGEQISQLVRILTVADIYDALTSDRLYRAAYSRPKAISEMRNMKDQLDQRAVDLLTNIEI